MRKWAPLFLTKKQFYKKVYEDEMIRKDDVELPKFHYELSKKAPQNVKDSYLEYCKERNLEPIFY